MHTQASQTLSNRSVWTTAGEFLLSKLISRHGKRIVFITSLYFQVVRIERLKSEGMAKLNQLMGLAASEDALQLPTLLRGMVWKNTDLGNALNEEALDSEITEARAEGIAKRVVEMAPAWVRYGRQTDMVDDVKKLIQNGSMMAAAA